MKNLILRTSGLILLASLFVVPTFALADGGRGNSGSRGDVRLGQVVRFAAQDNSGPGSMNSGPGNANDLRFFDLDNRLRLRNINEDVCFVSPVFPFQVAPQFRFFPSPAFFGENMNGLIVRGRHNGECLIAAANPFPVPGTLAMSAVATIATAPGTMTFLWTTTVPSTSRVFFGTAAPLNLATAPSVSSTALVTNHVISVSGLTPNTAMHFVALSVDATGNTTTSSDIEVMIR